MTGGDTSLKVRSFGPLDALYCQLRRRLPQILLSHVREPEERLRVTYRNTGPADLLWDVDAQQYRWSSGADPTKRVGSHTDLEEAVHNVAVHLGAATTGGLSKG